MSEMINKQIIQIALQKGLGDETIHVLYMKKNDFGFGKGIHFLSNIFKIQVTYTVSSKTDKMQTIDIIMKTEPKNGISLEIVHDQNLFMYELTMLKETLPKIEKLVHKQIGPKLWYGSPDLKVLIMESLTNRGFVMKNLQQKLSMEHCRLVIEQLAKLHAGSVALYEKEPTLVESFKSNGILSANCHTNFMRLVEVSLLNVSKEIRNWTHQKCAQVAPKLERLAKTFRNRCAKIYNSEANEFCVLNHGDCWINNIMFKENDNGKPYDVLMVDYQMSVYTSPAIDLHYFLNVCPEVDLMYEKDDILLNYYLETLTSTMISIGCITKAPTMKELKKVMHKKRIYAVFAGVVLNLRMMADVKDIEDFEEVLVKLQGETKMDVFKNPDAVMLTQKMIPIMDEKNYFD